MNIGSVKKTMITSVCAALCVVLPQMLRVIPNADVAYKAMHIPVLVCGLLCGSGYGLMCGVVGVLIAALLSGLPTAATLPVLLTECACFGLITGVGMKIFPSKNEDVRILLSLVFALLIGRVAAGAVAAFLFSPGNEALAFWIWGYFVAGIPSFVVQLILVPAIIGILKNAALVPTGDMAFCEAEENKSAES